MKHIFSIVALFLWGIQVHADPLIPQDVNESFMKDYSEEEQKAISEDMDRIHSLIFPNTVLASAEKHYIATAGGPGSGKSTVLENFLSSNPECQSYAYIDPDQRTLRFMIGTYLQSLNLYAISQSSSYQILLEENYKKWRGGSNYIANSFLNEAISQGFSIAHGTTSTSKHISELYDKLSKLGYDITLLLCFSPFESCKESINHRAHTQAFVQSSSDDMRMKYTQFFKTIPIYVKHAQVLHLYWIESFEKGAVHTATFSPKTGLIVINPKGMDSIKKLYQEQQKHDASLTSFEQLFATKKE